MSKDLSKGHISHSNYKTTIKKFNKSFGKRTLIEIVFNIMSSQHKIILLVLILVCYTNQTIPGGSSTVALLTHLTMTFMDDLQ